MTGRAVRECEWELDGLVLRGLAWGQAGERPVLALHGWQDNAASFLRLAPQLEGCHVVAPDLTGQGRSSFRSPDAGYQIWDDLPQIEGLLTQLGWEHCALLGHSRGAIIATLLASAHPEVVTHLALLDAMVPAALPETAFVQQLGRFLRDRRASAGGRNRRYPSREAAVAARAKRGLSVEAADVLASRGLEGSEETGWEWRVDPRLRGASAVKLSEAQIRAVLSAVRAPVLLLLARDGIMRDQPLTDSVRALVQRLRVWEVEGGHHFHLEPVIDRWVPGLLAFFEEH